MTSNDLYAENKFLTDRDQIIEWMRASFQDFDPTYLKIESDGLVYRGGLLSKNMERFLVKFKSVTDYFHYNSAHIISLEGCPRTVNSSFSCSTTRITSLKFCPQTVGRAFHCHSIKITDPKEYRYALYSEIGGEFNSGNKEMDNIINTYSGSANRKHWAYAINLLGKVTL